MTFGTSGGFRPNSNPSAVNAVPAAPAPETDASIRAGIPNAHQQPAGRITSPTQYRPGSAMSLSDTRGSSSGSGAGPGAAARGKGPGGWAQETQRYAGSRVHGTTSPGLASQEEVEADEDIPLSDLLAGSDPQASAKIAIEQEHQKAMADLRRLREERKEVLQGKIRDAVEKKDSSLLALLNEMYVQVDAHFMELQGKATWNTLQRLDVLAASGPNGSHQRQEELRSLRQGLDVMRKTVRSGIHQSMRCASESNCGALWGMLAQCQADIEDNIYQRGLSPQTSRQRDVQAKLEQLDMERSRIRAFLHGQMRQALENDEHGLWAFLAELVQDVEDRFMLRRTALPTA